MFEVIRKGDMEYGEIYCALCGENIDRDEEVIGNTGLLPAPYICRSCAEEVAKLVREYWGGDE